MKKKLMFLSGFFLSNLVISFATNNYQNVYRQILIQVENNLKLEAAKENNQNLKNNIITNFNKFANKSIKVMKVYQQAGSFYFLAEKIIEGQDYKNEVIKGLQSINVHETEIKTITNSYESALISQINAFNPYYISNKEKELDHFIDVEIIRINTIYSKTLEEINFNGTYIKEVFNQYDLLLRKVQENQLDNIEKSDTKLSLSFFRKVNDFLIKIKNLESHVRKYAEKVLAAMFEKISGIKSEIEKIDTDLGTEIPKSTIEKLHNFETDYFSIQDTFDYLKSEDFNKTFNNIFLSINTVLGGLKDLLLKTNKKIIDLIKNNLTNMSQNLVEKDQKITEPGVWESIVEDYKSFLEFKKEIAIISQDTKKLNGEEYKQIKTQVVKLNQQFDRIHYKGITKVENKERKWEIYLSAPDTQKLSVYANITGISIPVVSTAGSVYGTFRYMKKAGQEGATRWIKGRGAVFGAAIMALVILLDAIPVILINASTYNSIAGIKFEIYKGSLIGFTLGAAISLAATVEQQEKKYLTLEV
ncbi:MAG: hypothetical protein REH79_02420 [Spiroplasma sp.]|nr:hypothetical protein [Spiroplasma sp.]